MPSGAEVTRLSLALLLCASTAWGKPPAKAQLTEASKLTPTQLHLTCSILCADGYELVDDENGDRCVCEKRQPPPLSREELLTDALTRLARRVERLEALVRAACPYDGYELQPAHGGLVPERGGVCMRRHR